MYGSALAGCSRTLPPEMVHFGSRSTPLITMVLDDVATTDLPGSPPYCA